MVSTILIVSVVIAVLAAALGGAFMSGMLNPLIEKIGFYMFKAKAKAEKKKLQAMGMKEGRDFLEGDLKGNKQATKVSEEGVGGLSDMVNGKLGGISNGKLGDFGNGKIDL